MTLKPLSLAMSLVGVGLISAACSVPPPDQPGGPAARSTKRIIYATIWITSGPTAGTCAATTTPGRIQVKKQEDVEWSVVDICNATAGYTKDVELRQWSALDSTNCSDGTQIPIDTAATGKTNFRRGIKNVCADGKVFKYEIWVDSNKLADPELEIAS